MTFVFDLFPIPPSENNCYPTMVNRKTMRAFRFPSGELKAFKKAVDTWARDRQDLIKRARLALLPSQQSQVRVDIYIAWSSQRLYTKDGRRKSLDASNRIKPIHDALSELLGIDDRFFYTGQSEPVLADEGIECVMVKMRLAPMRTLAAVSAEMDATLRRSGS
jgi:hypothetical protein